jgi:poly-gamma-glutamate capsule biosynthesis protein CapA/YwtB (metallophosphatase superfamily)
MLMPTESSEVRILLVGDLILGEPQPDFLFDDVRAELRRADLVVGHLEVPHTLRGTERGFDVPASASDPAHLPALARAGFAVVTLSGNHVFDLGPEGVIDTIDGLSAAGVRSCGAGRDLAAAREPARVTRRFARISVLSRPFTWRARRRS